MLLQKKQRNVCYNFFVSLYSFAHFKCKGYISYSKLLLQWAVEKKIRVDYFRSKKAKKKFFVEKKILTVNLQWNDPYAFKVQGDQKEKRKAKGVRGSTLKEITFEDYKQSLFSYKNLVWNIWGGDYGKKPLLKSSSSNALALCKVKLLKKGSGKQKTVRYSKKFCNIINIK